MEKTSDHASPLHLAAIHIAVLLFGLAGLFARWVDLPSTIIVLGRVFFASACLWLIISIRGGSLRLKGRRDYFFFSLLGVLLALHWITFFQSIKVSTVAVGLLTFSTFPVFTAILEPIFLRERLPAADLLLALVTFSGVALVIPDPEWGNTTTRGAIWGVASGASFAVLSILNRKYVQSYPSLVIAFYQDLVATLVLIPFLFLLRPRMDGKDLLLLLVLGVVFTAISHSLFIAGLKTVKARTASIIGSLEPVYGISAAMILLQEYPSGRELLGGAIILATSAYVTLNKKTQTP